MEEFMRDYHTEFVWMPLVGAISGSITSLLTNPAFAPVIGALGALLIAACQYAIKRLNAYKTGETVEEKEKRLEEQREFVRNLLIAMEEIKYRSTTTPPPPKQ
jgi:hypothetical protein